MKYNPNKLKNYTGHNIVLRTLDGDIVIPPEKVKFTVSEASGEPFAVEGIPVWVFPKKKPIKFNNLPPKKEGVFIIVSSRAASYMPREDMLVPSTGPKDGCIKDGNRIIAVTRLEKVM